MPGKQLDSIHQLQGGLVFIKPNPVEQFLNPLSGEQEKRGNEAKRPLLALRASRFKVRWMRLHRRLPRLSISRIGKTDRYICSIFVAD
jgi:hypothetical protein